MRYLVSALILSLLVLGLAGPVAADVITDWSEKVQPIVAAYSLAAPAYRDMAMMHVAMSPTEQVARTIDDKERARAGSAAAGRGPGGARETRVFWVRRRFRPGIVAR